MKKITQLLVAFVLVLSLAGYAQANGITLGFSPSSSMVPVGSSLDVELTISGLGYGVALSLSVFDIDVMFDPAILEPTGVMFGDPVLGFDQLDVFMIGSNITSFDDFTVPGIVNLFDLSFDSSSDLDLFQPGAFTLATLSFNAIGIGTSPLSFYKADLGDANGDPLDADITNGSVAVIPEPATMLLLGTGLVGVAGAARRRKKNQA
jgi:hypothetical protein